MTWFHRYARWIHTRWPAGHVEKLPVADDRGRTGVPGLYVAGDLRGIPLLKFAADSGARVIDEIAREIPGNGSDGDGAVDVAIVGGGVAGMSAALQARRAGLSARVFEANEPFSTIVNFPRGKPIFTYPNNMVPEGSLTIAGTVKEELLDGLRKQMDAAGIVAEPHRVTRLGRAGDRFDLELDDGSVARARRVVCALGRSGNFRRLGVPGEDLANVYNRLHDPTDFCGQRALVVGGGDSALETAIALARCGGEVTLSYRGEEFTRPKAENIAMVEQLVRDPGADVRVENPTSERVTTAAGEFSDAGAPRGSIRLAMQTSVREITNTHVTLSGPAGEGELENDVVFVMTGREPPLGFFRRAGVAIHGEWTRGRVAAMAAFILFCTALYNWKSGGALHDLFYTRHWWPISIADAAASIANPDGIVAVILRSAASPSFWYTLAYSLLVVVFGVRRIRRRQTPYITVQTSVLIGIQVVALFLLPEILLPWLGRNGMLPRPVLDALFPVVGYGNGREYWRAYGLILAWPLNVYNVFTGQPLGWWLVVSFVQTFVLIPAIVLRWGKGAYCGWICSCGALAETLGDTHRTKMPHGPRWNRLNLAGQVILAAAFLILALRITGWVMGESSTAARVFERVLHHWKWVIDVILAGIIGYGAYFWLSGRVWCRFFCPLAALMHIYARFGKFRIFSDKKKCISCNVCTSVCHQGIDIMNFANKGLPMADPECVRCSACVQSCPTGVLTFGRCDEKGRPADIDRLAASPVQMREQSVSRSTPLEPGESP